MDASWVEKIDNAGVAYSEGFLEEWLTKSAERGTPASQQLLDNFKVVQAGISNYKRIIRDQEEKLRRIKEILS